MKKTNDTSLIGKIDALLEQERDALKSGNYEELAALLARKNSLVDALASAPLGKASGVEVLRQKAAHNQALLDSALQGIKSVSTRLAALQSVRSHLETYDNKGRKVSISSAVEGEVEKRA